MERFDPAIRQCSFNVLCVASLAALLVFLGALFLVG